MVEGLTPHTSYECIIAAMTRIGSGPSSAIVTVRTLEEGKKHFLISQVLAIIMYLFQLQVEGPVILVEYL